MNVIDELIYHPLFLVLPLPNPSPGREGLIHYMLFSYPFLSWEKGSGGRGKMISRWI
jgi:hypothetical protein